MVMVWFGHVRCGLDKLWRCFVQQGIDRIKRTNLECKAVVKLCHLWRGIVLRINSMLQQLLDTVRYCKVWCSNGCTRLGKVMSCITRYCCKN